MNEETRYMKRLSAGWEDNAIYVLHADKETIIIDPCEDYKKFVEYLKKINCTNLRILLTHGHEDHISAIPGIMESYPNAIILISEEDLPWLFDPKLNGSDYSKKKINLKEFRHSIKIINPGDKISIGKYSLDIVATPGHTPGSVIFVDDEHKYAFTGDTLFAGTIGATHFDGGDPGKMMESLIKIVKRIPDDYQIFPGHSSDSTMIIEKRINSSLKDAVMYAESIK